MAASRTLLSLGLPPTTLALLESAGFVSVRDVLEFKLSPVKLARELGTTAKEALAAMRLVEASVEPPSTEAAASSSSSSSAPAAAEKVASSSSGRRGGGSGESGSVTALEMLATKQRGIVSFVRGLDKMFGGGVPIGEVTELCGVPGIGKTQLSMQLALDVQIPRAFGGVAGEAVYIDTEGSLMVDRLAQIAEGLIAHLRNTAASRGHRKLVAAAAELTVEQLLRGVHVFRVHSYTEQLATVAHLATFLAAHPAVRLVVVDSVALHFRHGFSDMAQRTRLLARMAQTLHRVADDTATAVVLVNQMTTRVLGACACAPRAARSRPCAHSDFDARSRSRSRSPARRRRPRGDGARARPSVVAHVLQSRPAALGRAHSGAACRCTRQVELRQVGRRQVRRDARRRPHRRRAAREWG